MIRTEGLTKHYDEFVAVDNLSLNVEKGEIYGFLGPNGAGKTTTMMMLLGLLKPTKGTVKLFGKDLSGDYFGIKRRIGVLSEFHYLYEEMTALEYLRFFAQLYGVERPEPRIMELLEIVHLRERKDELLGGFSKGMKQKLSLARSLLHDPDIIFFDEPVSSLDPYGIREVRDIMLAENAKGKTIFISSHILSEIERTCNRVGIINRGQLLAEDTMEAIKRRAVTESQVDVEVQAAPEGLQAALRSLPFVKSVERDGNRFVLKTNADADYRAEISKAVAGSDAVLLDMHRHEISLEEAFVTITEQNLSLLTKEAVAV